MKLLKCSVILFIVFLFSCKTEEALIVKENSPNVITMIANDVSLTSVKLSGEVKYEGLFPVIERGFVYSDKNSNPILTDLQIKLGSGNGVFTTSLEKLVNNTKYFFKAYAINSKGTYFGEIQNFITLDYKLPTIITDTPKGISSFSAEVGGAVIDDGGSNVTQRGVCYGLMQNPTILDSKVILGDGIGPFNVRLENLKENSKYYLRAFATNSKGTEYGNELTFNTLFATTGNRDNTTLVKEVKSRTGRIWMDRNLGAGNAPIYNGGAGYGTQAGDLYQWGRGADGHQIINWISSTKANPSDTSRTTKKSISDSPGNSKFIISLVRSPSTDKELYFDWRETINNQLWQGNNGINNPCPAGFRLPTKIEFEEEMKSWGPLKGGILDLGPISPFFSFAYRDFFNGEIIYLKTPFYWTSTVNNSGEPSYSYNRVWVSYPSSRTMGTASKGLGGCVRCIKD